MFVVDIGRETASIKEANTLGIPVIGMVDTNCDPSPIEYVLPANDDAIRAIRLILSYMADAVIEGMGLRKEEDIESQKYSDDLSDQNDNVLESDEDLLGASTLAKLSSGELDFADSSDEGKGQEVISKDTDGDNSQENIDSADNAESVDTESSISESEDNIEDKVMQDDKDKSSKSDLEG